MHTILRVFKLIMAWMGLMVLVLTIGFVSCLSARVQKIFFHEGYLTQGSPASLRIQPRAEPFDRLRLIPHTPPLPEDLFEESSTTLPPLPEPISTHQDPIRTPEPLPQLIHEDTLRAGHASPTALDAVLDYFKYRVPLKDDKSVQFMLPHSHNPPLAPPPQRSQATYRRH